MKLFVGRKLNGSYELGRTRITWNPHTGFSLEFPNGRENNFIGSFCPLLFEAATHIKLAKGQLREIRKVKFTLGRLL